MEFGTLPALMIIESEGDCSISIVLCYELFSRLDISTAPLNATDMVLISDPELSVLISYSL